MSDPAGRLAGPAWDDHRAKIAGRAIYFCYYAALASVMPFLTLYYQDLGLSGHQIGSLAALHPLVTMVAAPTWGALADATSQHRRMLLVGLALSALSVAAFPLAQTFLGVMLCVFAFALFSAPLISLIDNSTLQQLGPRRDLYGKQRVWGSYGWGIAGYATGWMMGWQGLPVIFIIFPALIGVTLVIALRFPVSQASLGMAFGRGLAGLFTNRRWLLFLAVAWVTGVGFGMYVNFSLIFMRSIGVSEAQLGLVQAIQVISEIPFLLASGRLMRRFGPRGLLAMGAFGFSLRTGLMASAAAPWQALLISFLHGPTYAMVWVAGVEYASQIAPRGLGATAQGMFGGVYSGLGFASGALLGGWLFDSLGMRLQFRLAALVVFLAGGAWLLLTRQPEESDSLGGEPSAG
ncbi:MAG: MFS transporter [Anaerolineales bacterium]|nr:MFS transporter [Anaerolineales bacterium]